MRPISKTHLKFIFFGALMVLAVINLLPGFGGFMRPLAFIICKAICQLHFMAHTIFQSNNGYLHPREILGNLKVKMRDVHVRADYQSGGKHTLAIFDGSKSGIPRTFEEGINARTRDSQKKSTHHLGVGVSLTRTVVVGETLNALTCGSNY